MLHNNNPNNVLSLSLAVVPVQVTIQTDSVNDIPCGTSGGVMILFDKVSSAGSRQQAAASSFVSFSLLC